MDLTPDYSRVATSPTPEQWREMMKQHPNDTTLHHAWVDSREEEGDPNVPAYRYFAQLKQAFGGDKSHESPHGNIHLQVSFQPDRVLVQEAAFNESNAWMEITWNNGQLEVRDLERGFSENLSDAFQGVSPESLPNHLKAWWEQAVRRANRDDYNDDEDD